MLQYPASEAQWARTGAPEVHVNDLVMNLHDSDLSTFERLGIPTALLVLAGVERVTDQVAREKYGITCPGDMSGIAFPYVDPLNGRRKTARVRRDNPEIEAGQPKRKYVSAFGDRRHLYFPPAPRSHSPIRPFPSS